MTKISNNLTGVTGEYYVCSELGKIGILALLTPKNNPLFDIVAVSPNAKRSVIIQVKTMSARNNQGWKLNKNICNRERNNDLFVILVNIKSNDTECYIYEYDILSEKVETIFNNYMHGKKKDGHSRKDPGFRWLDLKDFKEEDYSRKNNWSLLKFKQFV